MADGAFQAFKEAFDKSVKAERFNERSLFEQTSLLRELDAVKELQQCLSAAFLSVRTIIEGRP